MWSFFGLFWRLVVALSIFFIRLACRKLKKVENHCPTPTETFKVVENFVLFFSYFLLATLQTKIAFPYFLRLPNVTKQFFKTSIFAISKNDVHVSSKMKFLFLKQLLILLFCFCKHTETCRNPDTDLKPFYLLILELKNWLLFF